MEAIMNSITESTRVGLNGMGDVVLFCVKCHETFEKKVQNKPLNELTMMSIRHRCDPNDVKLVQEAAERAAEKEMLGDGVQKG